MITYMFHLSNPNVYKGGAFLMPEWSIWLILAAIFFSLVFIQILVRAKRPVRKAISGILTGTFTSVTLPISLLSIGISAVAGIPGVTMLLILRMIM